MTRDKKTIPPDEEDTSPEIGLLICPECTGAKEYLTVTPTGAVHRRCFLCLGRGKVTKAYHQDWVSRRYPRPAT